MSAGERDLLDRLNVKFDKADGNGIAYARAEHVKITAGHDSRRICDYMVMHLRPGMGRNSGPKLHGFELKASRSDWLTEMRAPEKAEAFARYCDFFWLVISDLSIVRDGELPEGWGLMVASGRGLRIVTGVTRRENVEPMPRDLQATFARAVTKTTVRIALTRPEDPAVRFLAQQMGLRGLPI